MTACCCAGRGVGERAGDNGRLSTVELTKSVATGETRTVLTGGEGGATGESGEMAEETAEELDDEEEEEEEEMKAEWARGGLLSFGRLC